MTADKEPIVIPKLLLERLSSFGAERFIKVAAAFEGDAKSGKKAVEKGWHTRPYAVDDMSLLEHLRTGGNYGVLGGRGIIIIDVDTWGVVKFPKTFTVASGSGKGRHLYYKSNITDNGTISKKTDEVGKESIHIADIQVRAKYVVGPGCRHWTGGVYEIIDDGQFESISAEMIEAITKDAGADTSWSLKLRKEIDEAAGEESNLLGRDIPIEKLPKLDVTKLEEMDDGEYQGSHPIHGSMTGQNFRVNVDKNCWHCFRHNSGGGSLMWIAVAEGILSCDEAKPGALVGEKFKAARAAAERLGYKIEFLPDEEEIGADVKKFFKGKTFKPNLLGDIILESYPTITVGGIVYIYDKTEGTYIEKGEPWVRAIATRLIGGNYKSGRVGEATKYIMDKTIRRELPETDPEQLVVGNGILNVLTGELRKYTSDEFHISKIPTFYDPEAECPLWKTSLDQWIGEADKINTLQEFLGYTLYRAYPFPKALILHGKTRTGKTTAIRAWTNVLGKRNVSSVRLGDLIDDKFTAVDLFGRMMNSAGELDTGEIKNTAKFKAITGRDPIRVQHKGVDGFDIYPYAKLVYATNELPRLPNREDEAFFIRIILVRFNRQFLGKDADMTIDDRLAAEADGILNWAMEGLRRLMKRGCFEDNRDTAEIKESYLIQGDPLEYFYRNFVEDDYQCLIPKDHFAVIFGSFCAKYRVPMPTLNEITRRMRERGVKEQRPRLNGELTRSWAGIKWREADPIDPTIPIFYYFISSVKNKNEKIIIGLDAEKGGKAGIVGSNGSAVKGEESGWLKDEKV